jgi:PAS domain S-box-containing protein
MEKDTEIIDIKKKLNECKSKLKEVINQSSDSIIIHDLNGNIINANYRACNNLKYSEEELKKLNITDIEISIDKLRFKQLWDIIKTQTHLKIDGMQKRKDKTTFTTEIDMSFLNIINNNQIMIITKDITERKKVELEKIKLKTIISHIQKLESLSLLAENIAHHFNNLLTIIQGNTDLIQIETDKNISKQNNNIQNNLNKITNSIKQAAYLTKQMLSYSEKELIIENVDINELIIEMKTLFKSLIINKAILKINLTKDIGVFSGDITQIRQIIITLIINASESLKNNDGLIEIITKNIDYNILDNKYKIFYNQSTPLISGKYIYIEITDSGCGMNTLTKKHLYDPFYTTKKNKYGLGMSAVLNIIKSHKGAIHISSEINKGSSIKLIFPQDKFKPLLKKDYIINQEKIWQSSGSILIAEDEKNVAKTAKKLLEYLGFNVIITYDGQDTINEYKKNSNKYKYVFLDLDMPKLDGIEVFSKMRKINPNIKAFLCSGYNEKQISKKYKHLGLIGFIQKPYTLNFLIKILQKIGE